ncbi:Mo25-like protein [Piedraia hortae CBS 480.64]|uniref:Mo25-like protein n=1 Tax=Piedraia hortae CBS 480.64 TaxID=1314780 RepID=A0A6A7BV46_9PEZI|nr:Mo25-like protein [Piedraia hortae CBS 480.64]
MSFLFGRTKPRSTHELVHSTKELVQRLTSDPKAAKIEEELVRNLMQLKISLQGSPDVDATPEQVYNVVNAVLAEDVLPELVECISLIPFEARKDVQAVISAVFRYRSSGSSASAEPDALSEVLHRQPGIVVKLCHGYERKESASACSGVLKEALKWDAVAAVILYDERDDPAKTVDIYGDIDVSQPASGEGVFWRFFEWIDRSSFEISADAFDTFRLILTKHKPLVSQFVATNAERFFEKYNEVLIKSESYVTKRQSIKLLGELLLDRQFYEVMTFYVDSGDNLKLIMWQLKDERRMVQYEAFHVFKIFVANPNKSYDVLKFLIMNKDRLLKFLPRFLENRTDDEQFNDEKTWLLKTIGSLPDSTAALQRARPPEGQTQQCVG